MKKSIVPEETCFIGKSIYHRICRHSKTVGQSEGNFILITYDSKAPNRRRIEKIIHIENSYE